MTNIVGQTLKGMTKSVAVEEDAITISYRALYHGFKGDKRIPYSNITSVQFMEPGSWLAGYIQFSIKGAYEWHGPVNQDENAIQFDEHPEEFRELRDLVQSKMANASGGAASASLADEIGKLAALRDQGILTEEEFAAQKGKLLG
jgi:hypothetical protein